jgi:hypothetical protein
MKNKVNTHDIGQEERIECFLRGAMTSEEERRFLEELDKDSELRENALVRARLIKGMKQVDADVVQAFRNVDIEDVETIIKKISRKKSSLHWYAIAASFVAVLFVGYQSYDYHKITSLGKEYAMEFPINSIVRGTSGSNVEQELAMLFENIAEADDLDTTTTRLAYLWEIANQDTYNEYTDYAPYIGWYLAVGYLKDYKEEKAKDILKDLEDRYSADNVIGHKVRVILDRLY